MEEKKYLNRHIAHLGAIAFNYSMAAFIVTLGCLGFLLLSWLLIVAGALLAIMYYILLGLGAMLTLGLLLFSDEYRALFSSGPLDWLSKAGEFVNECTPVIMGAVPYAALVAGILSVIAFTCLMFDRKWEKSKPRLITLAIIVGVLIFIVIAIIVGLISINKGA